MAPSSPHVEPGFTQPRVADLQLRGRAGPLRARVYWPVPMSRAVPRALFVFLQAAGSISGGIEAADPLCRGLCSRVGLVVLSAHPVSLLDATTVTEWAADHAAELDAEPGRLVVGGEGVGGRLAAAVALHARDQGWPTPARQVLIDPHLDDSGTAAEHLGVSPLGARSVAGVAPATVVTGVGGAQDPRHDPARRYAARLRQAGVDVDELQILTDLTDLTERLRRTLGASPPGPGRPGAIGDP
jgi:acetyl esterase